MKVVIDIPEELLKTKKYVDYFGCLSAKLVDVLESGTLLPKGHGRLIDGDYLYKKFKANGIENIEQGYLALEMIKDEPTILEADKG